MTMTWQAVTWNPSYCWNPSVEDQAIDRVYRLGQTRPVEVIRFIAKNTVEERIMDLQAKKRELGSLALARTTRSKEQIQAERMEDLMVLFK